MKFFKRKTTKLEERILSLEQFLGVVHVHEYGASNHEQREWGFVPKTKEALKKLEEKGKK